VIFEIKSNGRPRLAEFGNFTNHGDGAVPASRSSTADSRALARERKGKLPPMPRPCACDKTGASIELAGHVLPALLMRKERQSWRRDLGLQDGFPVSDSVM